LISINHISKKYGNKTIINNLSLTIYEGEITFIVGSSGAGKSTLLNLIGGLDMVSSGEILYNGKNISVMERQKEIGIIKNLGAGDRNVFLTLWFDIAVISGGAMILSLLITKIFMLILPDILADIAFIVYTYPIKYLLLTGVLFMAVITVYTILGMKKLVKKMPALLLK